MTVKEAIEQLQREDPNAVLVIVPHKYQMKTLSQIRYENRHFYDLLTLAGKDASYGSRPAVVMIADYDQDE